MSTVFVLSMILLALAAGLLMGIVGGGGGGIYVAVLLFLLHRNIKTAAGTALILSTVTLSGAAWQYWRKKQIKTDYFILLSLLDAAGTFAGFFFMKSLNEAALKIIILCVLLLSGVSSILKIRSKMDGAKMRPARNRLPAVVPVGLIAGFVTGTTGLTAGTALSSCLIGILDFTPGPAVGTSTLVSFAGNLLSILALVLSSVFFHASMVRLDPLILFAFGIPSAAGAVAGAKLADKINKKVLVISLAAMAILPGIYLALQ